jgi:hypothetical protein
MMMISFTVDQLESKSRIRPPGYVEAVLEVAKRDGDRLLLTPDQHAALRDKFAPPPELEMIEPRPIELARSFAVATERWAAAGFPVVDRTEYDRRAEICDRCPFWDASARLGLGKCDAPGCGCTKFKRWLATEKCPTARW